MPLKCENCGNCSHLESQGNPGHSLALYADCEGGMNRARELDPSNPETPQDVDSDVLTQINQEGALREKRKELLEALGKLKV